MKFKSPKLFIILMLLIIQSTVNHGLLAESEVAESEEKNPLLIIQKATSEMISQLTSKKSVIAEDPSIVMGIVESLLIPHFAANTISRKVLGKHARTITKEEKIRFSKAFRFYMVRFYSKIFAAYTNQTFRFFPAPDINGKKRVTIKTQLVQSGARPIPIDYKMQRSGNSWKIIDLKIEGISMAISNRKQFNVQISNDGIETVIAKLEYKNKKALSHE